MVLVERAKAEAAEVVLVAVDAAASSATTTRTARQRRVIQTPPKNLEASFAHLIRDRSPEIRGGRGPAGRAG